ncbi:MAG: metallophosphoesterase family protein [Smithellaceae bacterium]
MRLGFFSDAHGNIISTIQCMEMMKAMELDECFFLGDAIGYLPSGIEVLQLLSQQKTTCIMGNHEAMATGLLPLSEDRDSIYRIRPMLANMPASLLNSITKLWPASKTINVLGKTILMVHGRPSAPLQGYLYQNDRPSPDETAKFDVIVMGHTHRPFIQQHGNALLINSGSCGLPRDIGNAPSFAVYDVLNSTAEIHRFKMDIKSIINNLPSNSVHDSVISCLHR